jgi:hypothetical protein
MKEAAQIDWEAIEAAYRAGVLSFREIARQHGVPVSTLHKRVTAKGWQRDLSSAVRQEAQSRLARELVAGQSRWGTAMRCWATACRLSHSPCPRSRRATVSAPRHTGARADPFSGTVESRRRPGVPARTMGGVLARVPAEIRNGLRFCRRHPQT